MKTTTPAVTVVIKKRKKADGTYPLFIHINWKGTRADEYTGLSMPDKDYKKKLWKSDRRLKKRLDEIDERVYELMSSRKPFTARQCLNKVENRLTPDRVLSDMSSIKRLGGKTVDNYRTAVKSFKSYWGDDMSLTDLTLASIQGYARTIGVSPVTVCTYIKKLHSLLNYSVERGWMTQNPMEGWNFKSEGYKWKDKPKSLSRGEVSVIINRWKADKNEAAGIWLSGYYFCGLAFTDLIYVDWDGITETTIKDGRYYNFTVNRRKTKEVAHILTSVTPLTRSLLMFLRTKPWNIRKNYQNFLNKELKKIIPGLTYYTCRHTFCSMMVAAGIPLNTISVMMGRSINGITAYITRITEGEALSRAATALRASELVDTPTEDIFLD